MKRIQSVATVHPIILQLNIHQDQNKTVYNIEQQRINHGLD